MTRAGQWVNINISPILLDIIAVSVALCSLGCQLPGSFDRLVGLIGCICSIVQCLVKMYLFSLWMFAFLLMSNVAMKVFSAASGQGIIVSEPECDIRENFDTNECPNIFVSTKLHE